jgi:hypothetical protein
VLESTSSTTRIGAFAGAARVTVRFVSFSMT